MKEMSRGILRGRKRGYPEKEYNDLLTISALLG